MRTEFGKPRSECGCEMCQLNCQHMPGFLLPSDLGRMIPAGADPFEWAKENLLASPGAKVMQDGKVFNIPTLVPATKPDGSCINYDAETGKCAIHENAPFGCAFFSCKDGPPTPGGLSAKAIELIYKLDRYSLYKRIWRYLYHLNKWQLPAEILRLRMNEAIEMKRKKGEL